MVLLSIFAVAQTQLWNKLNLDTFPIKLFLKKVYYNFLKSKMTYLNVLFCSVNNPKSKNILFSLMFDTENLQVLPFEKL